MSRKWFIAAVGTFIHLLFGTVYAWSFFQGPITDMSGWSNTQVAWAFSISILMLGLTSAWAGNKMTAYGPRKLAMIGGLLYGLGYLISGYALAHHQLFLLYLGFGLLGGIGLGLAYVTPVATVSAWFTEKQGLATGMVVMGFGFGALVMSKFMAPLFLQLSDNNLSSTFYMIGAVMLVLIPLLATFLKMPGGMENETETVEVADNSKPLYKYILSKPFIIVWLVFMSSIVAGMIFISFQSPLFQDLMMAKMPADTNFSDPQVIGMLAAAGGTLIAISSVFNGAGRFVWGAVSDKIGRMRSFRIILALQAVVFGLLIFVTNPIIFSVLVCVVLLSYGGGFGVLPSLAKDMFGDSMMASIYGALLTAWGAGGIVGPQIVAFMKDNYAADAGLYAFIAGGIILITGLALSFAYKQK